MPIRFLPKSSFLRLLVGAPVGLFVIGAIGACTGPRPVLIDPVPEATFDAAEFAASLPESSHQVLEPADPSRPGEPSAEDAIWVWGQRAGLDYQGPCASQQNESDNALCSAQVENFHVYRIGPNIDETWWVVVVGGAGSSYRVEEVYGAGQT